MTTITVKNLIAPEIEILATAMQVAAMVIAENKKNVDEIVVDMKGVRGAPSSFYNTLLFELQESTPEVDMTKVRFEFGTELQKMIFQRSFDAVFPTLTK